MGDLRKSDFFLPSKMSNALQPKFFEIFAILFLEGTGNYYITHCFQFSMGYLTFSQAHYQKISGVKLKFSDRKFMTFLTKNYFLSGIVSSGEAYFKKENKIIICSCLTDSEQGCKPVY